MASRPGFFFLVCPDSELIKARVAALLTQHPPESTGMGLGGAQEYERKVYWGDEGLDARFWEDLTLQSLMGGPKALIVRRAEELKADDWKKLTPALSGHNAQAWPFFCLEKPFDRGKPKIPAHITKLPFYGFAEKRQWIWSSPGLSQRDITTYLQQWARDHDLTFTQGALQALADKLPPDAAAIARELGKIELACGEEREIRPEMAKLINFEEDLDIFGFIEALRAPGSQAKVWQKVLVDRMAGDSMLFAFLALMAREARILWQLAVGEKVSVWFPNNQRQAKESLARKLGTFGVGELFRLVFEAEQRVKTGHRTPEQALELLVAGLLRLFHDTPSGGGGRPPRPGQRTGQRPGQGQRPGRRP